MESLHELPTYNESLSNVWTTTEAQDQSFPPKPAVYRFVSSTGLFRDLHYADYLESVGNSNNNIEITSPVISFHNLFYTVKTRTKGSVFLKTEKVLLNNVSGMFKQGMNAIMGPTGCGKTTLLDILAGRKDKSGLKGLVLVDGSKQPPGFNFTAGYVRQDDQVMGTLTVKENMMFSAHMRLPSSINEKDKKAKVEQLIEELGLSKCANTKVGTEFIRGVSGGERKRTCIGMELLVSRGVLFLDEPTTGLDAFTANSVMSLLQRLSSSGMTIIFSIHQPRYNIFKLFDTLMLLASGHIIFHGKASNALDFFHEQDFKCDSHNNPSDFFLDIISGDVSYHSSLSSSIIGSTSSSMPWVTQCNRDSNQDMMFNVNVRTSGCSLEDLKKGSIVHILPKKFQESRFYDSWKKKIEETLNKVKAREVVQNANHVAIHSTSFFSQLFHLSKRNLLNVVRNPIGLLAQVLAMIVFALVVGVLYLNLTNEGEEAIQNRAGSLFVIILVQMFGNLGAVEMFIKERSLFLHECKSGYYRVSAYFLSKIFCDLIPQRIIPLTFFAVITYFMLDLRRTVVNFFIFFLNLFLTTLSSAIGIMLLSATCRVFAIANVLSGFIILIMMLFGGLLLNVKSIAIWIRWIQYLSFVRYSFKSLLINELKDAKYSLNSSYPASLFNNSSCLTASHREGLLICGNNYLENQDVDYAEPWDLWKNMVALGVATLILAILCYVRLLIMVWKKAR